MRNLLTVIFSLFFLASCVEEIVMSPEEKRAVNVECVLENSETQTLHLNYTAYMSENSYSPIQEAEVYVTEYESQKTSNGIVRYYKSCEIKFFNSNADLWTADFTPKDEAIYELTIIVPDNDTITSSTSFLDTWTVNEVSRAYSLDKTVIEERNEAQFPIFGISSMRNSFVFWIYAMDYDPVKKTWNQVDMLTTAYHDSLKSLAIANPYYNFLDFFNILSVDRTEVEEFNYPEKIEIGFPEILEYGYPQYLHSEYNATTNPMHYRYLRIMCNENTNIGLHLDGVPVNEFCASLYIAANFKPFKYDIPHPDSYLVFMAVNNDYDKYLKSLLQFEMKQRFDSADITDIWESKNKVYSNISNGTGIFGTKYVKRVPYMDYKSITYKGTTYYKKYTLE